MVQQSPSSPLPTINYRELVVPPNVRPGEALTDPHRTFNDLVSQENDRFREVISELNTLNTLMRAMMKFTVLNSPFPTTLFGQNFLTLDQFWALINTLLTKATLSYSDRAAPATPSQITVVAGQVILGDGTVVPYIEVSWAWNTEFDMWFYTVNYEVDRGNGNFTLQFADKVQHLPGSAQARAISRLEPAESNTSYRITVGAVDTSGNWSARSGVFEVTTAGDTSPPGIVKNVTATGFFEAILLKWVPPLDNDLAVVEVWRSLTNNRSTATKAGEKGFGGISFTDTGLATDVTYYYWLRARDTSGNRGNWSTNDTAGHSATTLGLSGSDIADGTITSTQIADNAITTPKLSANSVVAAKIAANIITSTHLRTDVAVITVAAQIANALINDAHINNLSADKITAGVINVLVRLGINNIEIDGVNSVITVKDTQGSPVTRVQIGRLGGGATDYGIRIFDASGNLMWDLAGGATYAGIKPNAVSQQGAGGPNDSSGVGTGGTTIASIGATPVSVGDKIFVAGSCYAEVPSTTLAVIFNLDVNSSGGWSTLRTAVGNLLVAGPNSMPFAVQHLQAVTVAGSWQWRITVATTTGTVNVKNGMVTMLDIKR